MDAEATFNSEEIEELRQNNGRPRIEINKDILQYYLENDFTIRQIAVLIDASISTVSRRMKEYGLSIASTYSNISNEGLSDILKGFLETNPNLGYRSLWSRIRSIGHRVQRVKIEMALERISAHVGRIQNPIRRRIYSVISPLDLWHIDGNHKLIRWRFVIHGGIDGFSRCIMFMQVSDNNRAATVLEAFNEAVHKYGLPYRVRSDLGMENTEVAMFMLEQRGIGSYITGKSVHNSRIERLWRDLFQQATGPFYWTFWELENEFNLNPDNPTEMFALHFVFLPILKIHLNAFVASWNVHRMRTEHNATPMQMFINGLRLLPASEINEETYGIENGGEGHEESEENPSIDIPYMESPLDPLNMALLLLTYHQSDFQYLDLKSAKLKYLEVKLFIQERANPILFT